MNKKFEENKSEVNFNSALLVVLLSILISLFAFITEDNKITGFVAVTSNEPNLLEFNDVDSLSTLAAGNYYVDENGIVYWLDDESKPAIAKVKFVDEIQKNRHIYIDKEGRIGYVLELIEG